MTKFLTKQIYAYLVVFLLLFQVSKVVAQGVTNSAHFTSNNSSLLEEENIVSQDVQNQIISLKVTPSADSAGNHRVFVRVQVDNPSIGLLRLQTGSGGRRLEIATDESHTSYTGYILDVPSTGSLDSVTAKMVGRLAGNVIVTPYQSPGTARPKINISGMTTTATCIPNTCSGGSCDFRINYSFTLSGGATSSGKELRLEIDNGARSCSVTSVSGQRTYNGVCTLRLSIGTHRAEGWTEFYGDYSAFNFSTASCCGTPSNGGNISPASGSVCWNNNCPATPTFSVSGIVGDVVRWEYMRPGEGWTNWGGGGSASHAPGCFNVPGLWRFRAIVKNGVCAEAASSEAIWNANAVPTMTPYSSVNGSGWAIDQSIVLCQGGSFRLHPHPTTTTGWVGSGPAGFSSNRRDNDFNNVQPNQSGVYTFTHTDGNGCSNTTTYNVTVNSVPDLAQYIQVDGGAYQNVNFIRVCQGQTIVLDHCCDQSPSFSFRRPDGAVFPGGTNGVANDQILFGASGGNLGVWQSIYTKNGCTRTEDFTIVADAPSVGGTVNGPNMMCAGNFAANLYSVSGQTGGIVRWEYSFNNVNWNDWGGGGNSFSPGGSVGAGVFYVRALIQNGVCGAAYSSTKATRIDAPSVGGTVSGPDMMCAGNFAANLYSVSGQTGGIVRWEWSVNNVNWNDWGGGGNSFSPGGGVGAGVFYVRALIQNGACGAVYSSTKATRIDAPSVGGTITGPDAMCAGNFAANLYSVSGQTGGIVRWEWSVNNVNWNDWGGGGNSFSPGGGVGAGVFYVRALIQNGACGAVYSSTKATRIDAPSNGGTISPASGNICWNNNCPATPAFTVSGIVGSVVRWEYMRPGEGWTNWGGNAATAPGGCFNVSGQWRFRAIVKNGVCGEVASQEAVWNVNAVPTITPYSNVNGSAWAVQQNLVLCQGGSFALHPHPTTTTGWVGSGPAGFSSTRRDNDFGNAQPNQSGVYTFTHTDGNGCSNSTTYNVTVNPLPVITVQPSNSTVCNGASSNFSVVATGATAYQWEWSWDGVTLGGNAGEPGNNTANMQGANYNAFYRVRISNAQGCTVYSNWARTIVNNASVGGTVSGGDAVCASMSNFPAGFFTLSGHTGTVVRWEYSFDNVTWANWGGAGSTASPGGWVNNAANFHVRAVVQNGVCPAVYSSTKVTRVDAPSVGGTVSGGNTVCASTSNLPGGFFTLSGHTGSIVRWEWSTDNSNWNNWGGAGSTSSPGGHMNTATNFYVRVVVQNGVCVAVYSSTKVTRVDASSVGGTITGPDALCATANNLPAGTYTVSGHTGNILRWEWSTNNTTWNEFGAGVTTTTSPAGSIGAGNFYVRVVVQNGGCSAVYSSTKVTRVDAPSVGGTITGPDALCATANNLPAGTYTVSGHTGNILRWEWSINNTTWNEFGAGVTTTTSPAGTIGAGNFYVRVVVQNGACAATYSSVKTTRIDPPSVGGTVSGGNAVCASTSNLPAGFFTLSGHTGSIVRWEWSTDNSNWNNWGGAGSAASPGGHMNTATNFYVRVLVQNGVCAAAYSSTKTTVVNGLPVITVQPSNSTVCNGASSNFSVVATGATAYQWEWSWDGVTLGGNAGEPGNNTANMQGANYNAFYRVRVSNAQGCTVYSNWVRTIVNPVPVITVQPSNSTVCNGASSNFSVVATGVTAYQWEWSWDGVTLGGNAGEPGNNTANMQGANYNAFYRVRVSNAQGCTVYSNWARTIVNNASVGGTVNGGNAVCASTSNFPTGYFTLSGHTGSVLRWEYSFDNVTWTNWGGAGSAASPGGWVNNAANFHVRVVVQNGVCPAVYSSTKVTRVDAPSVGGTITGPDALCATANNLPAGTYTISGHTGNILRWEWSINNTTWNEFGAGVTTTTSPAGTIGAGNFYVRVVVQNGACAATYSSVKTTRIDPQSVGGTITGPNALCATANNLPAGTYTVSGHTGNILRWEWSTNNTTWNEFGAGVTATTSPAGAIGAGNFYVRVVVQNGVCTAVYSSVKTTRIDPPSVGGTITGPDALCATANNLPAGTYTVSGHTGSILRWEFSTNNTTWAEWGVGVTTTTSPAGVIGAGNFYVRVVVQNGACTATYSSTKVTRVDAPSVGGTVSGGNAVCASTSNLPGGFFTLSGHTGSIVRWEWSTDNSNWNNWGGAGSTSSPGGHMNTATNFYVRVVVQNGVCVAVYSSTKTTVVNGLPVITVQPSNSTVCNGASSNFSVVATGATAYQWEWSWDGVTLGGNAGEPGNNTANMQGANYNAFYRVKVSNTQGCVVYSNWVRTIVNPLPVITVQPSNSTVCNGASSNFSVVATGATAYQWEWSWDGVTLGGNAGEPGNNTANMQGANYNAFYRVKVSNAQGCVVYSNWARTIVNNASVGGTVNGGNAVCASTSNFPTGYFTLSGHTGSVLRWEYSFDNVTWTNWGGAGSASSPSGWVNNAANFHVRVVVQNGVCPAVYSSTKVTRVDAPSVGGTVSGGNTVCASTSNFPAGYFTLSGHTGSVVRWEYSTNNTTWADWGGAGSTSSPGGHINTATNFYVRVVVQNGACPAVYSSTKVTRIDAPSVGGTITGPDALCATANNLPAGTYTVSGHTGNILRWEYSTNNTTWAEWGSGVTTATSPAGAIGAGNFYVRVVVQNGACTAAYSSTKTTRIDQQSVGGTIIPASQSITTAANGVVPTRHILSGQVGNVVRWEYQRPNETTWTLWAGTTTTAPANNIFTTVGTWKVRAIVKNNTCAEVVSSEALVIVTTPIDPCATAPSVGGTMSGPAALCATANNLPAGTYTVSGHIGNILRWEFSTNNTTWNEFGAGVTTTTSPAGTIGAGNFYVRVVVQNGTCTAVYSSTKTTRIDPLSVGGTISGPDALCATANNLPAGTYTVSGHTGNILRWEFSTNNTTWNEWGVGVTTTTSPAGAIGAGNFYVRVVVQNGTCGAVYSSVKITRIDQQSVGGTVSPASQSITTAANGVVPTRHSLSGQVGNVVRWEYQRPNETTWTLWAGTATTAPSNCCFNIVGTWKVRAVVKNNTCAEVVSSEAQIIVTTPIDPCATAPSVGGTVSPASQTITTAANGVIPTRHSLSGQVGNVVRWEYQRPNETTWTVWAGTTTTAPANNIFTTVGTWKVRAIVKNNTCAEVASSEAQIIVTTPIDPCATAPSVGGTVSPASQSITTAANGVVPTRHSLSGQVGNVVRWEYQRPNETTWTAWVGTATTAPANNIFTTVGTWKVRAIVKNNTCAEVISSEAQVIVTTPIDPCATAPSVGGTVSPASQSITTAANGVVPTRHSLSGQVGNVVRWEYQRPNETTWTAWAGTATTAPANNIFTTVGTWKVRAIVKNNTCAEATSSEAQVIVTTPIDPCATAPSVGGTVSPVSQSITTAANGVVPTRHTLSGQVGNVVRWEYQRPNETTWTAWAGTATTAPANNIFTTVGTWKVRAIVKNNTCAEATSSVANVIVTQAPPTDDCESVTVRAGNGSIIFGNITTTQRAFIKVYSMTWQLLYTCNENCGPNLTVPNLSTGRYIVHIQYLSQSWQAVCNRLLEIDVIGGTVDCNVNRDNTVTKSCVNGQVVLTGTDLPGFEYMWLKGTSSCPSEPSQGIAGATGRNYTLPSSPTATTYYSRCARPIGCTTWGAITESNCITVNANECNTPNGGCESVIVEGKNNGTICISGMGTYTSQILIFNNQWQPVHNQQYNQNSTCVPLKNGIYQVKVQLYNTNGTWQFICEKMFTATVTGSPQGLVGKDEQFLMTTSLENNRARIEYVNNTGSENDYFEVEKLNLQTGAFEVMETVNARQTDKLEQYSSYDNTLVQGENTYKVTLVKHNGSRRSTAPQTLYYNSRADIALYPNPATDYIELDLKAYENQAVTIQIMNVFGTVEYSQKLDKVTKEPIHINLDNLASGQYMIQITTEKQKPVVKKITVQK